MLPKFSQIVNRLYAFIYETNHSKSGLGLPFIVALVMVIDKSWTSLEKHEKVFYTGLKKFIDDYKPLVDSVKNIRCPCKSCRLVLWVSIKHLSDHILKYGFDPSYKTWIHHGEPDLPPPPLVIDNTRQPQTSDMTACLNDLRYIPLNNEQNKPTQRDIDETSNDPTQAKHNEFEELYAIANEELYPGCDYVTRLHFMAKFTYFMVKGYKLPSLYYAIKKTFKTIGLGAWKEFDTKYLDFASKPRNVQLGLAADGFNPFGNLSQSYSMWVVILTTYNLPSQLCMEESSFMLTLLIPRPKSPSKDIDVYLRPFIDDLMDIWAKLCVKTIDIATGLKLNMRAMVLWTINDFLLEVVCLGGVAKVTRHALHKPHKWKRSLEFNGETKNKDPPREFSRDVIMTQLARLLMRVKGKHPSPEIDTYWAKFKSEFRNKDMKEEFLGWFGKQIRQRHIDNDPGVSESSELFALACGPSQTPILVNSCIVNGLEQILAFSYLSFKTVLFRVKWGVIVVEDDPDVIHDDNLSDLALSNSLNDLEITALHIGGQSIDVDAPSDIIDVVDEDDDIIDGKDPILYDLADFDDEDLVNLDIDDGVNVVYSSEEED
uniref:Transposase-associated domain-containing protein n=1 Tax=Tanacetum cinerariifolium TaxID=118510 RepID=A0A6L2MW03_TANCI|nr:hypothetical protein [Tanacetum cinerariifolium]